MYSCIPVAVSQWYQGVCGYIKMYPEYIEYKKRIPKCKNGVQKSNNTIKGGYIMADKSENRIQSEIMVELSKRGHKVFRANAGKVQDARTGTWIKLLPRGFSDLFGFKSDGTAIFIEVKTPVGKLRPEQIKFRDAVMEYPVIYGVARSTQEAIDIVENGSKYLN